MMNIHSITLVALAVGSLGFTGCATDPYTQNARTKEGAVIGGLLGAAAGGIIGNQSGRGLEGAAIGALAGGTAGGLVGNASDGRAAGQRAYASPHSNPHHQGGYYPQGTYQPVDPRYQPAHAQPGYGPGYYQAPPQGYYRY
ncbi:hypothetical protein BH23VER1_BH23VER1_33540 [soil metagenome]